MTHTEPRLNYIKHLWLIGCITMSDVSATPPPLLLPPPTTPCGTAWILHSHHTVFPNAGQVIRSDSKKLQRCDAAESHRRARLRTPSLCRGATGSCHICQQRGGGSRQIFWKKESQSWRDTEDQLLGECEQVIIFHLQIGGVLFLSPSHDAFRVGRG